jgi:hypothetical protein
MERTLIAFNLPNIITITLMAALGYIVLAAINQFVLRNGMGAAPSAMGGY